ncbi:MAG: hypothetical protein WCF68_04795 [Terriglobales bacterium]
MTRKTLLTALFCALAVFSMLGCGATNHLQSLQLTPSTSASSTSTSGLYNLSGLGGTIQLVATATYSNGKQVVLHGEEITYQISVDPDSNQTDTGALLLAPQTNTVTLSNTGLLTAIEPAVCTWVDVVPVTTADPTPTPGWAFVGDYVVTATYQGVVSQPVYIAVASAVGQESNPSLDTPTNPTGGDDNNPNGLCGPQPTS